MKKSALMWMFCTMFMGGFAWSQTTYTVDAVDGGADFSDLQACLAQVNATTDTTYIINITDTATVTYTLSGDQTMRDGLHLTFTATTPGVVTVDTKRLNVSQGGGTVTASDITFKATAGWCIFHAYDGLSFTDCTFGPAADNGMVIRGGNNTFTRCTFTGIQNNSVIQSGGSSTLTDCLWDTNGVIYWTEGADNSGTVTITGGGAVRGDGKDNQGLRLTGGASVVLEDFVTTGINGTIQRDFESGNSTLTATDCRFVEAPDSAVKVFVNAAAVTNGYTTNYTFTGCTFQELASAGGNIIAVDARGNDYSPMITLDRCVVDHTGASNGAGLAAWKGGQITATNTLIVGGGLGALVTTEGIATSATVELDHCVVAGTAGDAVTVGDFAMSKATVRNSIVDASCASGINVGASGSAVVEYNLINASGNTPGDPVFTGDPMFVDTASLDYHIQPSSVAVNKGVVTSVVIDIDGESRPMPAGSLPDLGLDEDQTEVPVTLSHMTLE